MGFNTIGTVGMKGTGAKEYIDNFLQVLRGKKGGCSTAEMYFLD